MKKNFIRIGRQLYCCKCLYQKYINGFYVPCGKCEFCRKSKARQWAFRLEKESVNQYVYNVLLTYDDENLYFKNGIPSLKKLHITEFMKRFRYYLEEVFAARVKFFLAGEYGGKFHRPHYHMILISDTNLEVEDSINGSFAAIHDILFSSWKKGFVNIEHLQSASASVRYLVQYLNNYIPKEIKDSNIDMPFRMMTRGNRNSRGLGYKFIEDNPKLIKEMVDNLDYSIKIDAFKSVPLPRYYKNIIAPEEHKIKMADDFYQLCQSYKHYLLNLSDYEKSKFAVDTRFERRRQSEREFEEYIRKKVVKRERSAGGSFSRNFKQI